ncbi:MAG: RHS repeat protein [Ardenticatenaceae bacterium]|nr:RHS repeat protein [Ardenticatenaceae bacterium]MCB8988596.1 RHS repeat protein [Ardenticatenaceae bacterium]
MDINVSTRYGYDPVGNLTSLTDPLLGRGLHLAAVAASQPVGMVSRPSHTPLAILQELV